MPDLGSVIRQITVVAIPVIFAITLHEAAHGYVALAFGDDTAKRAGRLSINPLRHIDLFGTILLPALLMLTGGIMFGWAKPVPVDFRRLRGGRLAMVAVAGAGPGMNVLLATLSVFLSRFLILLPAYFQGWLRLNLQSSIEFNLLLAVFNMIPIPPLDGGRVAVGLLPLPLASRLARVERYGLLILLGLLFVVPIVGHAVGVDVDIVGWFVYGGASHLANLIVRLVGP